MEESKTPCSDPERPDSQGIVAVALVIAMASLFFFPRLELLDESIMTRFFIGGGLITIIGLVLEWRRFTSILAEARQRGETVGGLGVNYTLRWWWRSRCFETKTFFIAFAALAAVTVIDNFSGSRFVLSDFDSQPVRLLTWRWWGLLTESEPLRYSESDGHWVFTEGRRRGDSVFADGPE